LTRAKTTESIIANSASSTPGILNGVVVSIVHTESPRTIRVICFSKAARHEQTIFFRSFQTDWRRVHALRGRGIVKSAGHSKGL
jgi:hypothetical protein